MVAHRLYHPPVPLGELHASLSRLHARQYDQIRSASDLHLEEDTGLLRTNGSAHRLQPQARRLLAQKLRIPDSYLGRCPVSLAAANVNHFLGELGSRPLLLRYQDDQVRAVLSNRYQPVDHVDLTRELLGIVPEETPVRYEWSDSLLVLQVLPPESQHASNGFDLFGGITVTNSETGCAVVALKALIFRVICLNGLVLGGGEAAVRRRHTRDSKDTLEEFRHRALESWSDASEAPDRLAAMRRIRVPEPRQALERLQERHQLRPEVAKEVELAFDIEPGQSLFELINAFTRAGNSPRLPLEERAQLQEAGGAILAGAERGRWL